MRLKILGIHPNVKISCLQKISNSQNMLLSQKRGMKYILKKLQIYLLSKLAIVFLEIVLKLQCFFSIALTKAMLTLYSHKILIQTFHTIDLHPQETLLHSLAELLDILNSSSSYLENTFYNIDLRPQHLGLCYAVGILCQKQLQHL